MEDDTARESGTTGNSRTSSLAAECGPDGEAERGSSVRASRSTGTGREPPRACSPSTAPVPDRRRASSGTVYLVGAGPGDPDLLTVRARWLIETADVILHDALVREALLESLPDTARIVDVGKRVEYKTPQSEINALMVEHATADQSVVRLKGGDPFVFGRGGEEAQYLAAREVPFEIVPGVSSVIAAPGVAGVPLTHRNVASRFTVITGHETPEKDESALDWTALAANVQTGGTLVILMGVRTLDRNVSTLREYGVEGEKPVALVQQATWTDQRVVSGTLETIVDRAADASISPPATAIVGDVVDVRGEIEATMREFPPV